MIIIQAMLFSAIFDIVTGILAAYKSKTLSSKVSKWGTITHGLIVSGFAVTHYFANKMGFVHIVLPFEYAMIFTYILSVIENLGKMGAPLPPKIVDAVKLLKGNNEK